MANENIKKVMFFNPVFKEFNTYGSIDEFASENNLRYSSENTTTLANMRARLGNVYGFLMNGSILVIYPKNMKNIAWSAFVSFVGAEVVNEANSPDNKGVISGALVDYAEARRRYDNGLSTPQDFANASMVIWLTAVNRIPASKTELPPMFP
jgi:hypothetical protein